MRHRIKELWDRYDKSIDSMSNDYDKLTSEYNKVKEEVANEKGLTTKEKQDKLRKLLGDDWYNSKKRLNREVFGLWVVIILIIVVAVLVFWLAITLGSLGPVQVPDAPSDWNVSDLIGNTNV